MTTIKLGLAQMRSEKGDWEGNLARVEDYMERAKAEGCDIVVFPEMSLSGYNDPALFPESVQALHSELVDVFIKMTGQFGIVASAGFIEANADGGKPYITQVLAQNGRMLGSYRKRHVVDEEADWFSGGDKSPVFGLGVAGGRFKVALAVCADSDNPDVFADAAIGGAKLVLHSSAPGLYGRRTDEASWQEGFDWYKGHLEERLPNYARKYGIVIAVATQTGQTVDEDFPGGSYVFGTDGKVLAGSPDRREMMVVCDVDIRMER